MATAIFAGQKATSERAPDQDAKPLVNRDWHKFVFGLARLQRVVDLLTDRPDEFHELRHADCLHQVPTGEVGHADVAHLAETDEAVERLKGFFERRLAVPLVQLKEIWSVPSRLRLASQASIR
jgi:hypothetical protein